ncbi:sugar phosphate isomerase/epimerase [Rhodococcus sp. T2V]|uniref:sugar phosphate isomerase/epimerase family protein n=1 Tax=Rhodococcus sp. T2V TaxID=3034164 RepID=UPI0023E160E2|nr:sugar phosphate isomerase/epimerase [Rhodococcus sp. T2V]MDF3307202.1 sugar phosphate isomerase/epimerase [Rhodococcus sp. T2V]
MEIGLLTDSLGDLPFEDALDFAAANGISTIELAFGGWSSAPHTDLDDLLVNAGSRRRLVDAIESRGLRLEALNASGNQLHPVHGAEHDANVQGVLRLAGELGIDTVVTMSGLPAAPGDRFPAWITTVWPPENLELLDHQWDVAIAYWEKTAALATSHGVDKIAIEMHANQLVYSVPSLLRLREAVGPTVGANFDPSHLWWMGADPLTAIDALSGAIHHVHAKDTEVHADRIAVRSRLEILPNPQVAERGWNYVAVGAGEPDGAAFWTRFADQLRAAGYDGPLSIENEDYSLSSRDSVALAARTLSSALRTSL